MEHRNVSVLHSTRKKTNRLPLPIQQAGVCDTGDPSVCACLADTSTSGMLLTGILAMTIWPLMILVLGWCIHRSLLSQVCSSAK